jgi:Protein of unknown function (DUF4007)
MALATGGFTPTKLTVAQILDLLPKEAELLKESFFEKQETGHPLIIGWNKIEFHRSFCRYAGLITPAKGGGDYQLSSLGTVLAEKDENLADLNSWWIVHTNLVIDPETNVYHKLFTRFPPHTQNVEEVQREMIAALKTVSESTIKKDVNAILNWFKESPLARLGLLVTDGKNWMLRAPSQPPDDLIVAYAASLLAKGKSSLQLSTLLKGELSLHTIFRLADTALSTLLRQASESLGAQILSVSTTAGIDTVYFGQNVSPVQIAQTYYSKRVLAAV